MRISDRLPRPKAKTHPDRSHEELRRHLLLDGRTATLAESHLCKRLAEGQLADARSVALQGGGSRFVDPGAVCRGTIE